mmetsp:Transcript_39177/g.63507  ORF Transcript_39177/g.63507 Transcript_39177/m.63507 type:complete len:225 (-) Transcript_39177:735-1409(-)
MGPHHGMGRPIGGGGTKRGVDDSEEDADDAGIGNIHGFGDGINGTGGYILSEVTDVTGLGATCAATGAITGMDEVTGAAASGVVAAAVSSVFTSSVAGATSAGCVTSCKGVSSFSGAAAFSSTGGAEGIGQSEALVVVVVVLVLVAAATDSAGVVFGEMTSIIAHTFWPKCCLHGPTPRRKCCTNRPGREGAIMSTLTSISSPGLTMTGTGTTCCTARSSPPTT